MVHDIDKIPKYYVDIVFGKYFVPYFRQIVGNMVQQYFVVYIVEIGGAIFLSICWIVDSACHKLESLGGLLYH